MTTGTRHIQDDQGPLTAVQVLGMSVEELHFELQARNLVPGGTAKPNLQYALLRAIGLLLPAGPAQVAGASFAYAGLGAHLRTSSGQSNRGAELQLQYRRLELKAEEKKRQQKLKAEKEKHKQELDAAECKCQQELYAEEKRQQQEHELKMKRLELGVQSGAALTDDRRQAPGYHINTAVKRIPKFNEHDIEAFLLSSEKIAQLNQFPEEKYATNLQAHLTGKALKVFTELSIEDCQDYQKLKQALLTAYTVVHEVNRKRFHKPQQAPSVNLLSNYMCSFVAGWRVKEPTTILSTFVNSSN